MSYDLYFLRPRGEAPLDAAEVLSYFERRANYQVDRGAGQAVYSNEQTGVYFVFELDSGDDEAPPKDADEALVEVGVSFNLNYFRPHVFGLEAEPELTAFVRHFGLWVDDPQHDGMGRGAYDPDGFLRGWSTGNKFGYRMALEQGLPATTLPSEEIHRIWRWNFGSTELQAQLGEDVFVPRISCAMVEGEVLTYAVWTDAIPIALPRVDLVILFRQQVLKRRWLGLLPAQPEMAATPWAALSSLLSHAEVTADPAAGDYYALWSPGALRAVTAFFRDRPAGMPAMTQLSMDSVLDQEGLDSARASLAR